MLILVGVFGGIAIKDNVSTWLGVDDAIVMVACILTGIASFVIPLVYMACASISADEITEQTLSLKNASVNFARAYNGMHRAGK